MTSKKSEARLAPCAALALAVALSAARWAWSAEATRDAGEIAGTVTYTGPAPSPRMIDISSDRSCRKMHGQTEIPDEDLLVSKTGGLENVFVYIQKGLPKKDYPVPEAPVVMDQAKCMFRPRVFGVRVGQSLKIANGDPLTHNVRSFSIRNRPFNMGQPEGTPAREKVFKRAERSVELQCDIHKWMRAYFFVMDHPFFAVTGSGGAFVLADVPPGDYTVAAWHEKLGEQTKQLHVEPGGTAALDFAFEPKEK